MPFISPTCEKPSACQDTRAAPGGTRRRWRCPAGHAFSTLEQVAMRPIEASADGSRKLLTTIEHQAQMRAIVEMRLFLDQMAEGLAPKLPPHTVLHAPEAK